MTLCLAITRVADECCGDLNRARATASKFKQVLTLFAHCHVVYCGEKYLSDSDLKDLGKPNNNSVIVCIYDNRITSSIQQRRRSTDFSDSTGQPSPICA